MNKSLTSALKAVIFILLTHISLTTFAGTFVVTPGNFTCTATVTNTSIVLSWTIDNSNPIDQVIVERSFNNEQFTTVGLVMGAEKSENTTDFYRFKDALKNVAGNNVVYYRQKVIHNNGMVTYTQVTTVHVNG